MTWDVFISHATEDKNAVADPLAKALSKAGLAVWYDTYELDIGDRLRRSIEQGLSQSRYGIIVLSPDFFKKHWPQLELDGLAQREENGQKVILPIWYNVTAEDVKKFSPLLADRIAATWDNGLDSVVQSIVRVVNKDKSQPATVLPKTNKATLFISKYRKSIFSVALLVVLTGLGFYFSQQLLKNFRATPTPVPSPTVKAVPSLKKLLISFAAFVPGQDKSLLSYRHRLENGIAQHMKADNIWEEADGIKITGITGTPMSATIGPSSSLIPKRDTERAASDYLNAIAFDIQIYKPVGNEQITPLTPFDSNESDLSFAISACIDKQTSRFDWAFPVMKLGYDLSSKAFFLNADSMPSEPKGWTKNDSIRTISDLLGTRLTISYRFKPLEEKFDLYSFKVTAVTDTGERTFDFNHQDMKRYIDKFGSPFYVAYFPQN